MAAGEGRRLRPLTEHYAKPVLPIDGRPVLATLLRELAGAGVGRVWLVTSHLAGQVGAVAVRREPAPDPPHRHAVRIEDGRVTRVLDDDPENPLAGAPLWLVGAAVARFLDPLPGNPPHELSMALQFALEAGG